MNKQEVLKKIEASKSPFEEDKAFDNGLDRALAIAKQLDEPEKALLSKEEAKWLERLKKNELHHPNKDNLFYYIIREGFTTTGFEFYEDDSDSIVKLEKYDKTTKMRLVQALFVGYTTIEKEKVYTAKLKSTNEYLNYDKNYKEIRHFKVPNDVANKVEGYHFTEDELNKYNAWKNEAYEVNEVKE